MYFTSTGGSVDVSSNLGFVTLTGIFPHQKKKKKKSPTSEERLNRYTKFDSTVDEGKEWLNPSREKNQGKHRRRKVEKSCVTPAGTPTNLTSRINGMTTHTTHTTHNTHIEYNGGFPPYILLLTQAPF